MKSFLKNAFYGLVFIGMSAAQAGAYDDYFRAIQQDNARAVTRLLQEGFDPNAPNEQGQVGLYLALREGSMQVAAALLQAPGLQVDAVNTSDETPLMMAALRGHRDWVERLLARGAQVNRSGWTPLHYAASGPDEGTVALLLARGAAVDALSPNRSTPLMMAARYGTEDAAMALLARGANRLLRNDRDMNAADFARSAGRDALARRLEPDAAR